MSRTRTIHLCHPFTARSIGWSDEAALPEFHSIPHAQALRSLSTTIGTQAVVSYFTDARHQRDITVDGLRYRFWPRNRWAGDRHVRYRDERSAAELLHESTHPSDVTIMNLSGHGSRFSHAHARVLRLRRRPYVAMIGGAFATTGGEQRRFLERSAAVAVHSDALRRHLLHAGFRSDHVVVVPLGVDTERQFTPDPTVASTAPVILFAGRIARLKGVHLLIEAVAEISATVPNVSLRLVGPEPDPDYSASLRDLVRRFGINERVTFTGALARQSLIAEYQQAALMVLPSQNEGYGMVVAESMACGTPVVGLTGSPGPEDMITSGHDGLLVQPADLAVRITALLRDPARLAELRHAARSTAVERLSASVTADRFEQLVSTALKAGR